MGRVEPCCPNVSYPIYCQIGADGVPNVDAPSSPCEAFVGTATIRSSQSQCSGPGLLTRTKLLKVEEVDGIESVYLWEGKIQTDTEELLIIMTWESLLDSLTEHVKANQRYEVPEVIALPITGGNVPYLEWLRTARGTEICQARRRVGV